MLQNHTLVTFNGSLFVTSDDDYTELYRILHRLRGAIEYSAMSPIRTSLDSFGSINIGETSYYEQNHHTIFENVADLNSEQDSCIILRPRNRQLMKKQIICHAYTFSNMAIGLGANGTRSHPVFRFVSLSFWPTTSSKMFKDDYKKGTIKDYRSLISIWIPMTRDVASRFLSVHKIKILPQIHPFLPTNHNHHHRYQHNFLQLQLSDGKLPTYVF